jgi:hypothetical protein
MTNHLPKFLKLFFLLLSFSLVNSSLFSQIEVIEIDTVSGAAVKALPYNKPVTIKTRIQTDKMLYVFRVEKFKHEDLAGTIGHYISKSSNGSYTLPEIPKKYYYTKKIGDFNFLFVTFADKYLLKPSTSYYLILIEAKADPLAFAFFDSIYSHVSTGRAGSLAAARASLVKLENKLSDFFGGNLNLGWYDTTSFDNYRAAFLTSFNTTMLASYNEFAQAINNFATYVGAQTGVINGSFPVLDSLAYTQLLLDSTINKEAVQYLLGKELQLNDVASDLNTISAQTKTSMLLSGKLGLNAIFADTIKEATYAKRVGNIDSSIRLLNNLKRSVYLLKSKYRSANFTNTAANRIQYFINALQSSRDSLKKISTKREAIEGKIATEKFSTSGNGSADFSYYSVISGDSYLNFETRNKVLLTPDFGAVTSSFSSTGKKLDYGLIPYLGFHINFMAVDKDITFKSYKKNWKQRFSFMVGWSLNNMNKDSTYSAFFEKASFLTGFGYRLNNVIRISAGTQWLFKLGKDEKDNPTKKVVAPMFVGVSFDLNIKQYLNGFADILSGIGKTKAIKPAPATETTSSQ